MLRHLRRNPAFIKKDEPFEGNGLQLFDENLAPLPVYFCLPFGRVE